MFKTVWPGVKQKWPAAYEILTKFQLTTEQQQPLMGAVDVDGRKTEDVSAEWVKSNEAIWKPIVDTATK